MPSTRRSILTACTAGIGALAGCVSTEEPTVDGDWPRRTLNNAHTGYATTAGPTTDLRTVWHRELPHHMAVTSPVVDDGTLYLTYSRDRRGTDEPGGAWLEAFDAATGDSRWTTELFRTDVFPYTFHHSDSLVVDGDRVFVQTMPGLTMLTTDGEMQWTFDNLYRGQQTPDVVTPVLTDDVVVAGTYGGARDTEDEIVYGINPATGNERWRATFSQVEGAMWQLAGTDDVVYVPFLGDGLLALDLTTGAERWRWEGPVYGTPTVVDDLVLVPLWHDDEYSLVALDRRDRSRRWWQPVGDHSASAGGTVADGVIYHVADNGIEARDLETGERVWRFGGERDDQDQPIRGVAQFFRRTTPVVSGDAVYAPGWITRDWMHEQLFVIDAAAGEELGRVAVDRIGLDVIPAVTSDLVFFATATDLYAFGECSFEVAGRCLFG